MSHVGNASSRKTPARDLAFRWLLAAFVGLRLVEAGLGAGPGLLPDSPMYLPVPGADRFSQVNFLGDLPRPWVVTLPYALAPNHHAIVAGQILLSISSWVLLLIAVHRLPFVSAVARWASLLCATAIGLSAAASQWDSFLQSDSLAQSGAVAFLAGALLAGGDRPSWAGVVLLVLGALTAGLIRPVFVLPMVVVSLWLGVTAVIRPTWPIRRRPVVRAWAVVGSLALLAVVGYVVASNQRTDGAWGREMVANQEIQGRTLQQVGVINMTAWGHDVVMELAAADELDCMVDEYSEQKPADQWRATIVARCGQQAVDFSRSFQSDYARWLITHPKTTGRVLIGPFNEAFQAQNPTNTVDLIPSSVTQIWSSVPPGINPVILWVVLLCGGTLLLVAMRTGPGAQVALLTLIAVSACAGVVATVAMSPLDAARVASAPAMVTRVAAVAGLGLGLDLAVRTIRRRGSQ